MAAAAAAAPANADSGKKVLGVRRYVVDLDLPPKERWYHIASDFKANFKTVDKVIDDQVKAIGKILGPTLESTDSSFTRPPPAASIVVAGPTGTPVHIRTMDWGMDFLSDLTIEVEFQRSGTPVFTATTWAGYVGILTGMRPNGYSVSVNFRTTKDGTLWGNVKKAMGASWPVGFLLREVLESESDFDTAVGYLSRSPLIAPCYYTIAGTKVGQGAIVTRNQTGVEQLWKMSEAGPIVQTNMDHWNNDANDDILYSIQRRAIARKAIYSSHLDGWAEEDLWTLISGSPLTNDLTIYGTYMNPTTGRFRTRLPDKNNGFAPFVPAAPSTNPSVVHLAVNKYGITDEAVVKRDGLQVRVPKECKMCKVKFYDEQNKSGQCHHSGTWHDSFGACNYVKCGFGLGPGNIGKCHWSCCYDLDPTVATCKKSSKHQE